MTEPLWCPIREHYCRCEPRCEEEYCTPIGCLQIPRCEDECLRVDSTERRDEEDHCR